VCERKTDPAVQQVLTLKPLKGKTIEREKYTSFNSILDRIQ
jgi:hypothetical protein